MSVLQVQGHGTARVAQCTGGATVTQALQAHGPRDMSPVGHLRAERAQASPAGEPAPMHLEKKKKYNRGAVLHRHHMSS